MRYYCTVGVYMIYYHLRIKEKKPEFTQESNAMKIMEFTTLYLAIFIYYSLNDYPVDTFEPRKRLDVM